MGVRTLKTVGEIWPGAYFDLVNRIVIQSRLRAHTWFPAHPADDQSILKNVGCRKIGTSNNKLEYW